MNNTLLKFVTSKKFIFALGLTGIGASVATAITGTIMADRKINELKSSAENEEDISKKEIAKSIWKYYVPCVVASGFTVYTFSRFYAKTCHENAALAGLVAASQSATAHLENKIIDKIGEKDARPLIKEAREEAIAETGSDKLPDRVSALDATGGPIGTKVINQNGDEVLDFIDPYSKARFRSTKRDIEKAVGRINLDINNYGKASFADFLDYIGVEPGQIHDFYGWTSKRIGTEIEAILDGPGVESIVYEGRPYICLKFSEQPETRTEFI